MVTDPEEGPFEAAFRALADPTRRAILELLAAGGRPVREIAVRFPMSRPAISRHLRLLREAGLAVEEKTGRERIYSARLEPLAAVRGWVDGLGSAEAALPAASKAARKRSPGVRATPPLAPARERREPSPEPRRKTPAEPRRESPAHAADDWREW